MEDEVKELCEQNGRLKVVPHGSEPATGGIGRDIITHEYGINRSAQQYSRGVGIILQFAQALWQ